MAEKNADPYEPRFVEEPDESEVRRFRDWDYLVGIGASAGGLESLEQFFDSIPEGTRCAFVVIQHLSPDFKSLMEQLLARHSSLTIRRAEDGMRIEADSIYLTRPRSDIRVEDGSLRLTDRGLDRSLHLPIDVFFESLAIAAADRAIAIVLSGSGSDGSRGVRSVKAQGGLVLAESKQTAKFDGMPASAMGSGVVDMVGTPSELANAVSNIASGTFDLAGIDPEPDSDSVKTLEDFFDLIKSRSGIDFTRYKKRTIQRRIVRRMSLMGERSLDRYFEHVDSKQAEFDRLLHDLLIGVTSFFRDGESFARLEAELPGLFERAGPDGVRVWICGCSTGEEAYSVAILLDEFHRRSDSPTEYRVFATDVRGSALEFASAGCYGESVAIEIDDARLSRYFERVPEGFKIRSSLRDRIVFAEHDVLSDPPFTRVDLVCCRNLMIYLTQDAQAEVSRAIHFALNRNGFAFLGSSEQLVATGEEFSVVDTRARIFRKVNESRLPRALDPSNPPSSVRSVPSVRRGPAIDFDRLCSALLGELSPLCLVLDSEFQVRHSYGEPGDILRIRSGPSTQDVLRLVTPELRATIAAGAAASRKSRTPISHDSVLVVEGDPSRRARVTIVHVPSVLEHEREAFLVVIGELQLAEQAGRLDPATMRQGRDAEIERMNRELDSTKLMLQSTVEEADAASEELQSTNEELLASNEELQSTNEELHSVNEELHTVNAEHQSKIEQLVRAKSEMEALMRSTGVGTIFLDRLLCIRKFTPEAANLVYLLDTDIGRPINQLSNHFLDFDLAGHCLHVIESSEVFESSIVDTRGRHQLVRIVPYIENGVVDGVVVSLIGVARILESTNKALERRFQRACEELGFLMMILDPESWKYSYVSPAFEHLFGMKREDLLKSPDAFVQVVDPVDQDRLRDAFDELKKTEGFELTVRVVPEGRPRWWCNVRMAPLRDATGHLLRFVGRCVDVTLERELWNDFVFHRDSADLGQVLEISAPFSKLFGVSREQVLASRDRFFDAVDDEDRPRVLEHIQGAVERGYFDTDFTITSPDGLRRRIRSRGWPQIDPLTGKIKSWLGVAFEPPFGGASAPES